MITNDSLNVIVSEATMLDGTNGSTSSTAHMSGTFPSPNMEENMDIDSTIAPNIQGFRHSTLVVATYPWSSGVVMAPTLSNIFEKNHFGAVSRCITHSGTQIDLYLRVSLLPSRHMISNSPQHLP